MESFETGTVVWARMTGWPWWPALIVDRAVAEEHMADELKDSLIRPSGKNRTVKFFNYEEPYDVVLTKNIREFVANFAQDTFRRIRIHKDEVWNVHKAAEIALAWINDEGSEDQRQALIGSPLIEELCRKHKIKFPKIPAKTQAPVSIARSFINPPNIAQKSNANASPPAASKSQSIQSKDDSKQETNELGVVPTNSDPDQHDTKSGDEKSSVSDKPKPTEQKTPEEPAEKLEAEENVVPKAINPEPSLQSKTQNATVNNSSTPEVAKEPPSKRNVVVNLLDSDDSFDVFEIPVLNYTQAARKRKRPMSLTGNKIASKKAEEYLPHFDFNEFSTTEEGDVDENRTLKPSSQQKNKNRRVNSMQTELKAIKEEMVLAVKMMEGLVSRIEKLEKP